MLKACNRCGRINCTTHKPTGQRGSTRAWRKTRTLILQRDHGICHLCHQPGADSVDHITPLAAGGTDDPTNLAAAHQSCNSQKGGDPNL